MKATLRATYRIQLHRDFTFDDAIDVLDHLTELGISHVYTSPVLESVAGSQHGYDVVDHTRVRAELGGEDGLRRLVAELRARDMGWIVDLVPNHVSVAVPRANPRWWDLLRGGRGSDSASWFDVDWDAGDGRVVLPVLGRPLEEELAAGALGLREHDGEVVIGYHELEVPVAAGTAGVDDIGADPSRLREILDAQHHRLSWWRAGDRNYRVFFDIDSLAAVRVEDERVFDGVHEQLAGWVADDLVDGVRVDHVDGLADPTGYLVRLRDCIGPERGLWVEKILMPDEALPATWPVDGTTGYEFARVATALAVAPSSEPVFEDLWAAAGGERYHDLEEAAKREVVRGSLRPELRRVVAAAEAAGVEDPEDALVELVVAFDAYRSYGADRQPLVGADDLRLRHATDTARRRLPDRSARIDALAALLAAPGDEHAVGLRSRFQQLTGPAMAKGAEDTALYRHHRLVALNEVGGAPDRFGVAPGEFHEHQLRVAAVHPATLLAGSTHDTKRSADVRARLAVLSQRPGAWVEALARFRELAADHRPNALDAPTELLLWQTVVGAWPIDASRLTAYLTKATREAKHHTTWTEIAEDYEEGVTGFARSVLADARVVGAVEAFVGSIDAAGQETRLVEVVLRHTAPGVPDTYQGDQDLDLSLVDPDNRRPVDHAAIAARLAAAAEVGDVDGLAGRADGSAKLWVTQRLLHLRRDRPQDLLGSSYHPLEARGSSGGVVAFTRGDDLVVAVDARPGAGSPDAVVDVPAGEWQDVLRRDHFVAGSGAVTAAALWPGVPIAVLRRS